MRTRLAFVACALVLTLLALCDLVWGSVSISFADIYKACTAPDLSRTADYLLWGFRLPKVLTAIASGAGIATAGLMMQSLFRNPLADTSILGVGSGAGLGVAVYTMAFALFPSLQMAGHGHVWGLITAAFVGAMCVLLLVSVLAHLLQDSHSILLVGVMIGFIASALISILQFFSSDETLKTYLLWGFGSLSGTSWRQLQVLLPIVSGSLALCLWLPKSMNALHLGERYTRSVGIDPRRVRLLMILLTSLISGSITAFTGPIAFLGIAVPHFTRLVYGTSNHRTLLPATMLSGAILMLLCDILTQLPTKQILLPINAVTALIGAPVVIFIMLRGRRQQYFS